MLSKFCSKCKEVKVISEFYFKSGKYDYQCKECAKLSRRKYGKTKRARELYKINCRTLTGKFCGAKRNARQRNKEWSITKEQYYSLIKDNQCYYCGNKLPEVGSGLDRIDNNKGYSIENVVPCCSICNSVKFDVFTTAEMLEIGNLIREILTRRKLNEKEG